MLSEFTGKGFDTGHILYNTVIFTQRITCKRVQEVCPHTRDPENPAEGLGPRAMSCTSLAEDLEPMAMSSTSPAGGLEPTTMCQASLYQGSALGRPKGQWQKLKSLHQRGEGAVPAAEGSALEPGR